MIINKYRVTLGASYIEFATEEEATTYCTDNSISTDTISFVSEEIVEISYIPDVTPRQIRQALILSGISMASIDEALASLSEPTKSLVMAEWEYSIAFQRSRPLVTQVGQMLGWTSEQLDNLWLFAGTL